MKKDERTDADRAQDVIEELRIAAERGLQRWLQLEHYHSLQIRLHAAIQAYDTMFAIDADEWARLRHERNDRRLQTLIEQRGNERGAGLASPNRRHGC